MASILSAGTSSGTALNLSGDTSGILQLASNNGTTAVTIDTSQNVGIGTTSPTQPLHISKPQGAALIQSTTNTNSVYLGFANGGGTSYVGVDTSTGSVFSSGSYGMTVFNAANSATTFFTNAAERMRIDSSGKLLVGLTSTFTTARSEVCNLYISRGVASTDGTYNSVFTSGAISFTNANFYVLNNSNAGVVLPSGNTSWSAYSDIRLKNITGSYTSALNDVAKLEPIKFTWKSDESNKPCVGLSAQSVEKVIPEAVTKLTLPNSKDETEYLSVSYTDVIPLLVASIQEQQALITTLQTQVAALQAKVGA